MISGASHPDARLVLARGPAAVAIQVADDARETLERWATGGGLRPELGLRAKIILMCADEASNSEVARRLEVSLPTVRKWRGRFAAAGLASLGDGEPRHRRPEDGGLGQGRHAEQASTGPLWQAIAQRLRDNIVTGAFVPGDRLNETGLSERFGVSRSSVREAIRELSREGLVVELPRRGALICTPTARDLTEVYEARRGLELVAAEAALRHAGDAHLKALAPHLDALEDSAQTPGAYLLGAQHDLAFHRGLVALSANQRIMVMYEQLLSQTAVLLRIAGAVTPTLQSEMPGGIHRDILRALQSRDTQTLRSTLDAHYRHALRRLHGNWQ